jgi:anti-sigma regulatory factor (Ser/Thr protein kinase)
VAGQRGAMVPAMAPGPLRRYSQVYPGRADQVSRVRAWLRSVLDGCPVSDEVELLASEMAANAVLHSRSGELGGQFAVRVVMHEGDHVRVEVADQGGPWDVEDARRDGRWHGLDLVDEMASCWGRESGLGESWVVWFRIDWPAGRTDDASSTPGW